MTYIKQETKITNIGLTNDQMKGIIDLLQINLADEFTLYTKLRRFHWNVTGPHFKEYHLLFENHYEQISIIKDEIAEYIRNYDGLAIGTFEEFQRYSRISNIAENEKISAEKMIHELLNDNETIIRNLREDSNKIIDKFNDPAVEDLFISFIHKHQKMAWELRSILS